MIFSCLQIRTSTMRPCPVLNQHQAGPGSFYSIQIYCQLLVLLLNYLVSALKEEYSGIILTNSLNLYYSIFRYIKCNSNHRHYVRDSVHPCIYMCMVVWAYSNNGFSKKTNNGGCCQMFFPMTSQGFTKLIFCHVLLCRL